MVAEHALLVGRGEGCDLCEDRLGIVEIAELAQHVPEQQPTVEGPAVVPRRPTEPAAVR